VLGVRHCAVELEVPKLSANLNVIGARQADTRIPLVAVGGEVPYLLDARATRLMHAEVGEEAMKVSYFPFAAEKPRNATLMVLKKHHLFHLAPAVADISTGDYSTKCI
jgi:hypothetical protein